MIATIVRRLGSPPLTLAAFAAVGLGVLVEGWVTSAWRLAGPFALVAVNLACAIATRPRLRRGGLGVFHAALFVAMIVAAVGRLSHVQGRVEVVDGAAFDPSAVEITSSGPFASGFDGVAFAQGAYTVDYLPGLKRMRTRSTVVVDDGEADRRSLVVGDDVPLVVNGWRFYTTHNKGYAALLAWTGADGATVAGAVHFPSYPRFDWKQEQTFMLPGAGDLMIRLDLPAPADADVEWRFAPSTRVADVVVVADGREHRLAPGAALRLAAGTLRYEGVRGWMGYRIDRDPSVHTLLAITLIAIAGLAVHVLGGSRRPRPAADALPEASA